MKERAQKRNTQSQSSQDTIEKVGIARIGQNVNSTDILPPTLSGYNLSIILEVVKRDFT